MPVVSLWLQVMVFSKNQSEEEIDEMHSNYSKWLGHICLYEAGFAPRGPGGPIQRFLLSFLQYVLSEWMNKWMNEWAFIVTCTEKRAKWNRSISILVHAIVLGLQYEHTCRKTHRCPFRQWQVNTQAFWGRGSEFCQCVFLIPIIPALINVCIHATECVEGLLNLLNHK